MNFRIAAGVILSVAACHASQAVVTYNVPVIEGDATALLQQVIDKASGCADGAVINLAAGATYHVYRNTASAHIRYISNTTSEQENPDNTKYIALHFHDAKGLTFNGNGAKIVTHGELTTFAVERSDNLTLRNFTLDAADHTVPEFTIVETAPRSVRVKVTEPARYEITADSTFFWIGEGWRFTDGLAQVYFPDKNITLRYDNPIKNGVKAVQAGEGVVDLYYDADHRFRVGEIYQMRHTIRNQVCGFINESSNVVLDELNLQFIGNFGIVSQNSRDITVSDCRMAPDEKSGRTCAGFADFLQFSGCRGHLQVENCYFAGAHDDAINVHGTHLSIVEQPADNRLIVRYMHNQSRGFNSFYPGDSVEVVNVHTLLGEFAGRVIESKRISNEDWLLTLDRDIDKLDIDDGRAVENVSATPSLTVTNCYFTLVPTRGILVTTRRKVEIINNVFDKIPMPSIYISDDARGWYESGPVRDVTIRGNKFIECGSPVIGVNPENDRDGGDVHRGVKIIGNEFVMRQGVAVSIRSTADVVIKDNKLSGNYDAEPYQVDR